MLDCRMWCYRCSAAGTAASGATGVGLIFLLKHVIFYTSTVGKIRSTSTETESFLKINFPCPIAVRLRINMSVRKHLVIVTTYKH